MTGLKDEVEKLVIEVLGLSNLEHITSSEFRNATEHVSRRRLASDG